MPRGFPQNPVKLVMHLHSSLILLCGAFGLPSRAYPTRDSTSFKPLTSRVCGTGSPSEGLRSAHHKLHARHRLHTRQTASSPIVVDTYIHFVTTEDQAPYYTGNVVSTLIGNQVWLFFFSRIPFALQRILHLSLSFSPYCSLSVLTQNL